MKNADGVDGGSSARDRKSLAEVVYGTEFQIVQLDGPEQGCYRLLELGFTPGAEVMVVQALPFGGPLVVVLRGTRFALRKKEAEWIIVR